MGSPSCRILDAYAQVFIPSCARSGCDFRSSSSPGFPRVRPSCGPANLPLSAGSHRCAKPKVPENTCSPCFLNRFLTPGLGTREQMCLPRPNCVPHKGSTGTLSTS